MNTWRLVGPSQGQMDGANCPEERCLGCTCLKLIFIRPSFFNQFGWRHAKAVRRMSGQFMRRHAIWIIPNLKFLGYKHVPSLSPWFALAKMMSWQWKRRGTDVPAKRFCSTRTIPNEKGPKLMNSMMFTKPPGLWERQFHSAVPKDILHMITRGGTWNWSRMAPSRHFQKIKVSHAYHYMVSHAKHRMRSHANHHMNLLKKVTRPKVMQRAPWIQDLPPVVSPCRMPLGVWRKNAKLSAKRAKQNGVCQWPVCDWGSWRVSYAGADWRDHHHE